VDGRKPIPRQFVHLEKQQAGEYLYVIAVGHAVAAQHIAENPQALDDGRVFDAMISPD
jgi:hypothetical protein